jgi:hypothetical protein
VRGVSGDPNPAPRVEDDEAAAGGDFPTIDALGGSVSARSGDASGAPTRTGSIGRFKIERTLGAGGMGVVYLAEDPSLGRKVAIKLLHDERARHPKAQARLQREARALASLSHPHVVVVHEVGLHDDQVYLVMEHVAGVTLREWTRAHAGDWRSIVAQYRAAGEGLAAAHRAGIIHRDFKPDNVLVDEDGRPRVLDFGLAAPGAEPRSKDVSWDELGTIDMTKTGTMLGTPAYMAPEQFLRATVDARTDQFSFCVALWEALFGKRPFAGDDVVQLSSRVIAGQRRRPPSRTRVPRSIVAALCRGLCADPNERFASMSELLQALAEPPWGGRRVWAIAGSATLASLGVAAWLLHEPAPLEPPPPPSPPTAPAVVAEPGLAAEAPPVLVSRQLTHTTGLGVMEVSVGVRDRVVIHSLGSATGHATWWLRPLSGGEPRKLPLSATASAIVHPIPDGAFWIVEDERISRVRPDGTVERVIERLGARASAMGNLSALAPDHAAIAIATLTGFEIWDLTGASTEPLLVELGDHPIGLAWSPDARRIAATASSGWKEHRRLDVFDADGSLRSSTPWPAAIGGRPLLGLSWLATGLVSLATDESTAWVQCLVPTETGIVPGRRSAAMPSSPHTRLVDVVDEHTLVTVWPDVQPHLVVLELLGEHARQHGPSIPVRRNKGAPVWRSDAELTFLAAEPAGALARLDLADPERVEVIAPGPFEWAAGDGEGGIVLGPSDDGSIEHWAEGAVSPRRLRLPGLGEKHPFLRCRAASDCLMTSTDAADVAFFAVDLERGHVRRRFECPSGAVCLAGRWSRSHDGQEVRVVDESQSALIRMRADTGERIAEPRSGPPGTIVQSSTHTSRGELLVTGMLTGEPPPGWSSDSYLLMRFDDDGSQRLLWTNERTWIVRPQASPSGRHVVLEGLTFHSEVVTLELGSLCAAPP